MPITVKENRFHLFNDDMSYVITVGKEKELVNLHFGSRIDSNEVEIMPYWRSCEVSDSEGYCFGLTGKEYPTALCDYRSPAIEVELPNGLSHIELKYSGYEIIKGKPKLEGLPAVYTESDDEAETLKLITTGDGIEVSLYYTLFKDMNVICRHSEIKNISNEYIYLTNAQSASIDFVSGDYEYLHLGGAWAREKHIDRNRVHKGTQGFESRRGASGHAENPFMAFFEKGASETYGNVYGFSLVYSGNHKFLIESEAHETVRIQAGINPFNFRYKLLENDVFTTPELVMVYSESGFEKMSQTYHKLYRTRLCRGKYRDSVRPVLINNWEGTYFDFNRKKLLDIADVAADMGMELFVLDDGWFGKRNNDKCSLGDWFVNEEKLGGTLKSFAEELNNRGLKFGLWFEPEMISPDSDLYRAHPDWAIQIPDKTPHLSRDQLVLDYTRKEVRDYIVETLSDVLKNANIEYIKWDMNRNISDVYSTNLPADRQGEFFHRYILGLYDVLERITSAFPDILFEGCSGGGGRNDPGMLYYMPQNWSSDDTDAVERLYIQYGGSFVYPASTVGSHVSAVPNHQSFRTTSLSMRGAVAMTGAFGYEFDLTKMNDEDKNEVRRQVELYKKIRSIIAFGDYYRLKNPHDGRISAWIYVTDDKKEAVCTVAVAQAKPNSPYTRIKLRGLNPDAKYQINDKVMSGKTLMNYGIDYTGMCFDDLSIDSANYTYILKQI